MKEDESKCSRNFFISNNQDREKTPCLPQPLAAIPYTCEERNWKRLTEFQRIIVDNFFFALYQV